MDGSTCYFYHCKFPKILHKPITNQVGLSIVFWWTKQKYWNRYDLWNRIVKLYCVYISYSYSNSNSNWCGSSWKEFSILFLFSHARISSSTLNGFCVMDSMRTCYLVLFVDCSIISFVTVAERSSDIPMGKNSSNAPILTKKFNEIW